MYAYRGKIDRVVDGDTVDVVIDLGFTIHTKQRVRLEGINAPEMNTAAGREARAHLEKLLPAGGEVVLRSYKPMAGDKYGRYLARILFEGHDINATMVADGHALTWDGSGKRPT